MSLRTNDKTNSSRIWKKTPSNIRRSPHRNLRIQQPISTQKQKQIKSKVHTKNIHSRTLLKKEKVLKHRPVKRKRKIFSNLTNFEDLSIPAEKEGKKTILTPKSIGEKKVL